MFTLIEVLTVTLIVGILTAILVSNISSKNEQQETAVNADLSKLQTAIDKYQLDHKGDFPISITEGESDSSIPTLGHPKNVDFQSLYPTYLSEIPENNGTYYWIDFHGKVYHSTVDNPKDFRKEATGLSWTPNENASAYIIYEVTNNLISSSHNNNGKKLGKFKGSTSFYVPPTYSEDGTYLIIVVDADGNESAPITTIEELPDVIAPTIDESPLETPIVEEITPTVESSTEESLSTEPITAEQEVLIQYPTNRMVAASDSHTLVVDESGVLWSFGSNRYGQLGYAENSGTTRPNPVPKQVLTNVQSVAVGRHHTLAVKENGELWSFGRNKNGQLGHNTNFNTRNPNHEPQLVMTDVQFVSTGSSHTLVIKTNGELWTFGDNQYGQLGHEGPSTSVPQLVMTDVQSVSSGGKHSLVVKTNGELWSFGYNYHGQLGYVETVGLETRITFRSR